VTAPLVLIAASLLRIPARRIRALVRGEDGALRDWLANESATRLAEARRDARVIAARLEALGARVVALDEPTYPAGLRDLGDPPPFLVVLGTLAATERAAGTAIVGTREPEPSSARAAYDLATVAPGPIVSGLALGIDAAAHRGALAAGTPTIAYVANGFGATYPPEHAGLEVEIVAAGGAILTEALPAERVTRWALVRRDRLQAAHAAALVLVESDADGGAMHAVAAAERLGRMRYAARGEGLRFGGNRLAVTAGAATLAPYSVSTRTWPPATESLVLAQPT